MDVGSVMDSLVVGDGSAKGSRATALGVLQSDQRVEATVSMDREKGH